VADNGYHSRAGLKELSGGWKTRIAEPKPAKGHLRRHGDVGSGLRQPRAA
jgi:transposase